MEWFTYWWDSLGLVGQIMATAAIPMSIVMLLQLILMLVGAGFDSASSADGGGADDATSTDEACSSGSNSIFKIFTVRGIVAFFALGGWAGLAALSAGLSAFWAIWIALLAGVMALLLASFVIQLALRMQQSGNIDMRNAISQIGEVYIRVPALRTAKGKVMVLLQERLVELDAVTDGEIDLLPKSKVEVVDIAEQDCLVVRQINENGEAKI